MAAALVSVFKIVENRGLTRLIELFVKEDVVSADRIPRAKWFCINTETRQKAKPYLESRLVV